MRASMSARVELRTRNVSSQCRIQLNSLGHSPTHQKSLPDYEGKWADLLGDLTMSSSLAPADPTV